MNARTWNIGGLKYRKATENEIATLQALAGAPHVYFACLCGETFWHAKNLALSNHGGYNGSRNIFHGREGEAAECRCLASNLVCVVPEDDVERAKWIKERTY